jgi:C_GCAxxG_C_C family probable redox protein
VCQEFELEHAFVSQGIANLFAGGFGNTGAVCGAVVGATMAIGLKMGRGDSMEESFRNLAVAAEFRRRFEAEMETISCRELTEADLTTDAGLQEFMKSDTPMTVCFPAVGLAYRLAVDLLNETP